MHDSGKSGRESIEEAQKLRARVAKLERVSRQLAKRKSADEQLDKAWSEWEKTFDATKDSIMLLDSEFKIVQANLATSRFLGKPLDQIVGSRCWRVVHGTKQPPKECPLRQAQHTKKHEEIELRIPEKDIWITASVDPILDDQGNVNSAIHIIRDITERKRAEEAYRSLVDHSLQGLAIFQDGRIVFGNQAMTQVTGYTVDEMLAAPPEQVRAFVHPEDRALVWTRHRDRLAGKPLPDRYELRGIRNDGSTCWLELYAKRIDYQGRPAIQAAYVDITERKKAEEDRDRLFRAVEIAKEAVSIQSSDLVTVYANDAMNDLFGYEKGELIGKHVSVLNADATSQETVRQIVSAIKKNGYCEGEVRNKRKDGSEFLTYATTTATKDQEGNIVNFISTQHDVTARKKVEEQIERLAKFPDENLNPVLRISKDCTILYANNSSSVVLETWQRKVGQRLPDDCCKRAQEALSSGKVSTFEFTCHDGRVFLVTLAPIVELGYVNAYGLDITERKKAEQKLRLYGEIMLNMSEGVYGIRASDGVIIHTNPKLEQMFGYAPGELIGKHVSVVNAPTEKTPQEKVEQITKALNQKGSWRGEILNIKKDGMPFWCYAGVSTFEHPGHGKVWVSMHTDITERKKAERKLLDYQAQLKSLASQLTLTEERERRRIATELHDRISQSMAISKIKLDGLRRSVSVRGSDQVLEEVCDLLGQAIADTRSLTSDLSSPILHELGFEAAVAAWLSEEIERKYGIATEFEKDEQPKPLDDDIKALLFRDVRELLINVVKHAHANKVKVSIRRVGRQIHIGVQDDGVGFDPVEVASKAAQEGGFGLFSIRERLEELGGHLEIKSKPGRGCKVTMMAPLKDEAASEHKDA